MAGRAARAAMFLPSATRKARRAPASQAHSAIESIWDVVGLIPRGRVSTYGAVARAAGLPGRARLARRALREAPGELHLPWHRVLGAGGRIVFPKASAQHREQSRRLRAERVIVKDGRVDPACIMDFERDLL